MKGEKGGNGSTENYSFSVDKRIEVHINVIGFTKTLLPILKIFTDVTSISLFVGTYPSHKV